MRKRMRGNDEGVKMRLKPGTAEIGKLKIVTKRRDGKSRQNSKARNCDTMRNREIATRCGGGKSRQSASVRQSTKVPRSDKAWKRRNTKSRNRDRMRRRKIATKHECAAKRSNKVLKWA